MISHLIMLKESQDLHIINGRLCSGSQKVAIETLASVQSFSNSSRWSQQALEALAHQCPVILATWNKIQKKWLTISLQPRCRYVNPTALWNLCRLPPQKATHLASSLIWAKVCNQHLMLSIFNPRLKPHPDLKENSFNRILRLEGQYAKFFWSRYFDGLSQDLFLREKQKPTHPLNVALNYGYGFLYHAIEWQCVASGLQPDIGIIHKLRKNRPSLACDLIEPLRCCVELTVARHLLDMAETKRMAGHFAEMLEAKWVYKNGNFRLRTIIRLMVESFIQSLNGDSAFQPFRLHARDACL